MKIVTDEQIQTALRVLDALRVELKAHTKRRIKRVPDNVAWDTKVTWIEYDLRGNLSSLYCLKQELKHWIKRRLKKLDRLNHHQICIPQPPPSCAPQLRS